MKPIIFTSLFLTIVLLGYSQNIVNNQNFKELENKTYKIIEKGSIANIKPYIDALNLANFNNHRLKSDRNTIEFEDGIKIILFSAEEVINNGYTYINLNDFPVKLNNNSPSVFKLAENNYIIELKQIVRIK